MCVFFFISLSLFYLTVFLLFSFSVYFIFIYPFSYFTISKFQSIHDSKLHFIISNSHYKNNFVSVAVSVNSSPSDAVSVLSLSLTSLSESTNMMTRSISSSSATSLFQYSCSISRTCLQQADHSRSPMFSLPSSMSVSTMVFRKWRSSPFDVAFQIRPYHLNGVKIRTIWWEAYSCVSRRFKLPCTCVD